MALWLFTENSKSLLSLFESRIRQKETKEKIITWEISSDGKYYTHRAPEWNKKAWFRASVLKDRLLFNIIKPKSMDVTTSVYAYYHGHMTETFLAHFDKMFTAASSTALPTTDDRCSS